MTDKQIPHAKGLDNKIGVRLVEVALANGWAITVNDGLETTIRRGTDEAEVLAAMGSTGEDYLSFFDEGGSNLGTVWLIWQADVNGPVTDHSDNGAMNDLVDGIHAEFDI